MHYKHNATCPWLITARVYPRAIRCSDVAKFDPIEISLQKSALCRTFTGSLVNIMAVSNPDWQKYGPRTPTH